MIHIQKQPIKYKPWLILLGVACILDGLIRVISFGFLFGGFSLEVSKRMALWEIMQFKKQTTNKYVSGE